MLLPDGAPKYLSKIFDDEWMRENGFLDEEKRLGTVRDLLAGKPARTSSPRELDATGCATSSTP